MINCSLFFFSSRRRHTRWPRDWSSDVCSSDLATAGFGGDDAGLADAVLADLAGADAECLQRAILRLVAEPVGLVDTFAKADGPRERIDHREPGAVRLGHQKTAIIRAKVERGDRHVEAQTVVTGAGTGAPPLCPFAGVFPVLRRQAFSPVHHIKFVGCDRACGKGRGPTEERAPPDRGCRSMVGMEKRAATGRLPVRRIRTGPIAARSRYPARTRSRRCR